jgi:hypothetical protein
MELFCDHRQYLVSLLNNNISGFRLLHALYVKNQMLFQEAAFVPHQSSINILNKFNFLTHI